jgi:sugar phosphate isomerase/epimerase
MRIALCNEVLRDLPLQQQCDLAARLGYDGLELAPFTLGPEPHRLGSGERRTLRRSIEDAGLSVVGLHWLLVAPEGLSITAADAAIRSRTIEVLRGLVVLCAELDGRVLVHGSPAQRQFAPGEDAAAARARAVEAIALAAEAAAATGLTYCRRPCRRRARPSSTRSRKPPLSSPRSATPPCAAWSTAVPPPPASASRFPPSSSAGCRRA